MGSADWMPRNLDNRVEVVTPVANKPIIVDNQKQPVSTQKINGFGLECTM
jgi:polyphosphate kinase